MAALAFLTTCTNPTWVEATRYAAPAAVRPQTYDPELQWNMEMINAPGAWAILEQLQAEGRLNPVVVAVVDTGVRPEHSAFEEQVFALFDKDDPARGYDFYDGSLLHNTSGKDDHPDEENIYGGFGPDADPRDPGDENTRVVPPRHSPSWHGTHVSGIVAAGSAGSDVVGVLPLAVQILPIRALGKWGGSTQMITDSILYAAGLASSAPATVQTRAHVINLSLGGGAADPVLYEAIQQAVDRGITVVAASGNDQSETLRVPAYFDNTIAVGALNTAAEQAWYSNYGRGLDFVAPGGDNATRIHSTVRGGYGDLFGTSMATPHVAGVAAALYAVEPGLNQDAVYTILRATARDLGAAGWDRFYGHGLVDAQAALEYLLQLQRRVPRMPMGEEPGGSRGISIATETLSGAQFPQPDADIEQQSLILRLQDAAVAAIDADSEAFEAQLRERFRIESARRVGSNLLVVQLSEGQQVLELLEPLGDLDEVQYSQPNYRYQAVR